MVVKCLYHSIPSFGPGGNIIVVVVIVIPQQVGGRGWLLFSIWAG